MAGVRKVISISSSKDIKPWLQVLEGEYEIRQVEPPLKPSIINETDYLLADYPHLVPILSETPGRLRWVQGTWAGVDKMTAQLAITGVKPSLLVSRLSHPTFSQLMAEYALCAVISMERKFKLVGTNQDNLLYERGFGITEYRSLNELSIGLLGVGEIGSYCAKVFKDLGCIVYGLVNTPRGADSTVSKYFVRNELSAMLSSCDYIINILPSTPQTDGILANDAFKACKMAGFVNIGRGNVCSDTDITRALDEGWLSEAFLDVFPVEPLPLSSVLWKHNKVTMTPHVAAKCREKEIAGCFIKNLEKFQKGNCPDNLIDWNNLY